MDSQVISSRFYFDCASALSLTLHFIHNQFSHPQISLHSIYLIQKPTHGAPNLHQFSEHIAPSPAQPYYIGPPISVVVHSSQIILYSFDICKKPLFPTFTDLFIVTFSDLLPSFGQCNPCLPWLGKSLSSTPVDIIHIL
jgi:hypothetical protein